MTIINNLYTLQRIKGCLIISQNNTWAYELQFMPEEVCSNIINQRVTPNWNNRRRPYHF